MLEQASQPGVSADAVARRLNVSKSTVYRALRDDPRISLAVRQRAKEVAREMGFRPDPMLAVLAHYRQSVAGTPIRAELAWLHQWPEKQPFRGMRELELYWKGACQEAEKAHFRLQEFTVNRDYSLQKVQRILSARNIRGILIPPHHGLTDNWRGFDFRAFSVVCFGYSSSMPRAYVVTSNHLADGMLAFEQVWKHGYRRIGFLTAVGFKNRFVAGYLFSQMLAQAPSKPPPLFISQPDLAKERQRLRAWARKYRLDAILTDISHAREFLLSSGIRVPEDMGMADLNVARGRGDAGIDQSPTEIGSAAVRVLVSLIRLRQRGMPDAGEELLIEGRWVDGPTLPPRRNRD